MGHPNELPLPLYTTHQGLCKFSKPEDSNYLSVKEQLVFLVKKSIEKGRCT